MLAAVWEQREGSPLDGDKSLALLRRKENLHADSPCISLTTLNCLQCTSGYTAMNQHAIRHSRFADFVYHFTDALMVLHGTNHSDISRRTAIQPDAHDI